MNTKRDAPPSNLRSLQTRIDNEAAARNQPVRRIMRAVANVAVGQMLPPSVVKGGTAMKLRVGEPGRRFTPDFDASRPAEITLDDYIDELADLLADGWSGFTGTVEQEDAATPDGVPPEYVMQPFSIRLAFRGRHWLTVAFELGHDEIGSTKTPDLRIADDLITLFDSLGLETPAPIPVLALEHQIAQKLHACTYVNPKTGQNDRAHDLVDLQIIEQEEAIDMAAVAATAERLFAARQGHEWPPTVVQYDRWATIYTEAATGLDVIADVTEAVIWVNDFIARAVAKGA